ncbi:TRAP transporter permease [Natrinema salifodinae]|uniref:TRAP transporter, 4TM/12TM fusion protein n=1 Tax=Natrinema salifodinae TaxID=1202768 RepID=A0A1I0LYN4_9EURY|nr:TRAP transporter fused permease subunit [Natrinema salifodinae]SEV80003.1 TRAP transporter, 4TM/12TM fusion protein [Natrinema salifodinae]
MFERRSTVPGSLAKAIDILVLVLAVIMWGLAVYYAYTQMMPRAKYTLGLFGLGFSIYILDEMTDTLEERDYLDLALLVVSLLIVCVTTTYLLWYFDELLFERTGFGYHDEYVLALMFTLTMFYLIFREFGTAFLGVIVGGSLYAWLGDGLPGILGHGGLTPTRIMNVFVLDFTGFFGSISGIVAAWVSLFLLYAGLLEGYGAFDYVMRIAFRASEYLRSGIAQSAVIASLAIGSINGSQVANTAMTGSVTIPLMKESGLKRSTAAGVESVASSGGQIMPPVMGAAAFIMASILGITYFEVLVAGIVPALVFYISVAIAVHYSAVNQNIKSGIEETPESVGEKKSRPEFVSETLKLGIPFAVLVYALGIAQWTVMSSALYTAISMVIMGITFPLVERLLGWNQVSILDLLGQTLAGLKGGATIFGPIVVIVAAINGIADLLVTTGVPGKLALALIELSGGVLLVALVLAMVICIVLGLGMPTVAAYTIVALLVAPALIEGFGLTRLPVHYFVFYAAILSGITPPIAIAVVVASGIAEANFWSSAFEAVKIAAPLFVLPFALIYNAEIVAGGLSMHKLTSSVLLLGGAAAMVHGLNYYGKAFDNRAVNYVLSAVFVVLGTIVMAVPSDFIRLALSVVLAILVTVQFMQVNELDLTQMRTVIQRRI